jgi:hypothetical protein
MANSNVTRPAETRLTYDDPLLASQEFSYSRTLFPLGFPLKIETNSEDVLEAAAASWSFFPCAFEEEPIVLSVGVSDGTERSLPRPPTFRSRNHLLSIVSDAENFLVCDFARGYHFGWISQTLAEEAAFLRYYFLDVAVLTMVQQRFLAPIHGACVARNGRGMLLCGPSSAGKSTLAYGCSRAGWTYVSDDATFLLRSGPDRYAIGNCHSIRFRESTKRLFPELFSLSPSLRPNGTRRIETFTRDLPISTAFACVIDHLVFLDRNQPGPARLERALPARAFDWFAGFACYGEESVRNAQLECYRKLAHAQVWELRYRELEDALRLLDGITPQPGPTAD